MRLQTEHSKSHLSSVNLCFVLRCFKNIDTNLLPVHWFWNKTAWMTTGIMQTWLTQFNDRMKAQKRKILLFMDIAMSHVSMDLSIITIAFFPPNTTSVLQPMDQGVIYTMKLNYRKRVLSRLAREIDSVENVSELCGKINVLDAIQWLVSSTNAVTPHCVESAFKRGGFNFAVDDQNVTTNTNENDITDLMSLMHRTHATEMTVDEFIAIDSDVHTESDTIDVAAIADTTIREEEEGESEKEESNESQSSSGSQPTEMELLTTAEMFSSIERMKQTALAKGETILFNKVSECLIWMEEEMTKKMTKQTTMDQFFKKI